MLRDITITEARQEITSLPEKFAQNPGAVAVTRRGERVLAVMPWELYESLVETLEILGDEELMGALRQGIQELEAEEGTSWEDAKKELGWDD